MVTLADHPVIDVRHLDALLGATPELPPLPPSPHRTTDRNPYAVYVATFPGDEARRAMAGCLNRIAALLADHGAVPLGDPAGLYFPWASLRYQHTAAVRSMLLRQTTTAGRPWAPAYINKHLIALRQVLRHAWLLGQMPGEGYHRASEVKGVKGVRLPVGRYVSAEERQAMVEAAVGDGTLIGLRDAAIIEGLYSTGCRRSEWAAARSNRYDHGGRALRVIGKGDKEREVYFTRGAAARMGRWLAEAGRGECLVRPVTRWGRVEDRPMTANAIGKVVSGRAQQAGIPHVSAHDLRRSLISDLLDAGEDLSTAQGIAGHASVTTTAGYDRRPARTRQAAVDRLDQGSTREYQS